MLPFTLLQICNSPNRRHHNWQPIHHSFTLRITMEPNGQFGWVTKQQFKISLPCSVPYIYLVSTIFYFSKLTSKLTLPNRMSDGLMDILFNKSFEVIDCFSE